MREILDKVDELVVQLRRIAYALEFQMEGAKVSAIPCIFCGSLCVEPGKKCPICFVEAPKNEQS